MNKSIIELQQELTEEIRLVNNLKNLDLNIVNKEGVIEVKEQRIEQLRSEILSKINYLIKN